jgi:hypothetical protein
MWRTTASQRSIAARRAIPSGTLTPVAVLLLWVLYCLRRAYRPADRDFARAAPALMAGIVLVDWLAVVDVPRELSLVFLGLFGATLLLEGLAPPYTYALHRYRRPDCRTS